MQNAVKMNYSQKKLNVTSKLTGQNSLFSVFSQFIRAVICSSLQNLSLLISLAFLTIIFAIQ